MEKRRVHCIVRQLYLTWLVCCNSVTAAWLPPSPLACSFWVLSAHTWNPHWLNQEYFSHWKRWGGLYKKVWMWVRLLRREEAFAHSFALGCLDVIIPKRSTGNHAVGLCYSKFDVSELVLCVFSKHKLDGDTMKFREVLHPEYRYSCVFEGGLGRNNTSGEETV